MADKFDKMAAKVMPDCKCRVAAFYPCPFCNGTGERRCDREDIAAALRSAVEEEREACALIADNDTTKSLLEPRNDAERRYRNGYNDGAADANEHVARDIRARGEVKR